MVELISVHIPKAAGTTFRDILFTMYNRGMVLRDYADRPSTTTSLYNRDRALWERTKQVKDVYKANTGCFRAIHGHFMLAKYAGEFPEARRIVWLRDPVERALSNYYYSRWKARKNGVPFPFSVEDFCSSKYQRNTMSRFLRGYTLENLFFVGIVEHFQEDLCWLGGALKWPKGKLDIVSKIHRKRSSNPERRAASENRYLRKFISEANAKDVWLYKRATKLRTDRMAK